MRYLVSLAAILAAGPACAHSGHAEGGAFLAGFLHPVSGLDHVLAMLAVGLVAAFAGGMARVALPMSFLGAMLTGFVLSAGKIIALPAYEAMILASVFGLGLALAFALRLPLLPSMAVLGVFGLAHGFAHGVEGAPNTGYVAGFLLATANLHLAGLAIGVATLRLEKPVIQRGAGLAILAAGAALAFA
ncbi:HupE Hydrogenase/urease accessory protein [Rhabdaerophilaceae bacterium]